MRRSAPSAILIAGYAVLLVYAVLSIPLRIPEILQLAAGSGIESLSVARWIALTPESAPLNYYVQLPFLRALGYTRLGARLDTLLFALAACYLFVHLARHLRIDRPLVGLAVFMLLPLDLRLVAEGQPFAQALFLLLLATEWFLRLIERPGVRTATVYATFLTLCIYTDRSAFLPAVGYLLFLLRFVNRPQERRAIWFALPATVLPVFLFLPFYLWAAPQDSPYWPYPPRSASDLAAYFGPTGNEWVGLALLVLLFAGTLAGAWATFRPSVLKLSNMSVSKRISLFCLFGGVVSTVVIVAIADVWLGVVYDSHQILWAVPSTILLTFTVLDSRAQRPAMRTVPIGAVIVLILFCAVGDYFSLTARTEDMQSLAGLVQPELAPGACVVFVTERFSKMLFQLFAPRLRSEECINFFHKQVVLAIHPYVRPEQQEDAESFFRGLNFVVSKRIRAGGGQIVVMQQVH